MKQNETEKNTNEEPDNNEYTIIYLVIGFSGFVFGCLIGYLVGFLGNI